MSKTFTLEMLTEGIRQRHLGTQNKRLVEKWSRTGLLRGLNETGRENMARMLENQAAQVLKEASSVGVGGGNVSSASGDLRGFSNIAFPIVRRVFGGLVANELVSVQPMSLPSGLLFYLDYTYGSDVGDATSPTYVKGESIYNSPVGKGVRSGSLGVGGQYDLAGSGYSRVHAQAAAVQTLLLASGAFGGTTTFSVANVLHATGADGKLLGFDPQLADAIETNPVPGGAVGPGVYTAVVVPFTTALFGTADATMVKDFGLHNPAGGDSGPYKVIATDIQAGGKLLNVRRLNRLGVWNGSSFVDNPLVPAGAAGAALLMVVSGANAAATAVAALDVDYVVADGLDTDNDGSTLTIPSFESTLNDPSDGLGVSPAIPEIDIKVESIAVTAVTRKLRAKWSPELAQDLNAYHSLDAEVELTQILSEQIAMELDREILNDLLTSATGANYFWSRAPGKFLNKATGAEVTRATGAPGPNFTGTVREWYETFIETIIDVANQIHRKTLRGSANFIVVGPDLATILEASVYYRPSYTLDGEGQVSSPMSIGAEKVGTLSNRFTVYKDPYFPRNKVLVGYKGGSYLETGYVYAPYVPLIVTPTIFNPDDFTPRKGVMTRYGKKLVRGDFYGTVTVTDLNVI